MPRGRAQAYRTMALKLHPDKRKSTQREGACCRSRERRRRSNAASCRLCASRANTPGPRRAVAEREFNALQKAYEMLWCAAAVASSRRGRRVECPRACRSQPCHAARSDDAARAAWDGLAAARQARRARDAGQDERRKRMREGTLLTPTTHASHRLTRLAPLYADLEARERDFATRSNEEEVARARLRNEIARLRRAAAERAARGGAAASPFDDDGAAGGSAGAAPAPAAPDAAAAAQQQAQLQRTLKLVWNRGDGDYTAARLRQARVPRQLSAFACIQADFACFCCILAQIFSEFGGVDDVVLRDGKKQRGGALVVMATAAAAVRPAACLLGCMQPVTDAFPSLRSAMRRTAPAATCRIRCWWSLLHAATTAACLLPLLCLLQPQCPRPLLRPPRLRARHCSPALQAARPQLLRLRPPRRPSLRFRRLRLAQPRRARALSAATTRASRCTICAPPPSAREQPPLWPQKTRTPDDWLQCFTSLCALR